MAAQDANKMRSTRRSVRLFGTDGVRGIAGSELTPKLAFELGQAAVKFLGKRICVGRDTRRSGTMLEAALVSGIMSSGGDAYLAGIIPTPAIALIARKNNFDGGVVISASHNPPKYNGIKFFSSEGFKLPDALEDQMQAYIEQGCPVDEVATGTQIGRLFEVSNAEEQYIQNAMDSLGSQGISLDGMKIVVDCGHGASYKTTPETLRRLGADVVSLNTSFDGDDINVGCGSTNLDQLKDAVLQHKADVGIAHDGDADRMLAVDECGNVVDGDQIEAICAVDLLERGLLDNTTIVSTVMCNIGLQKSMSKRGISVVRTNVGDRYVLESMREGGYVLGGEQSGHMIFLRHNTTGDGLITALNLLAAMRRASKPLSELSQVMTKYPQSLINVPVEDKAIFETSKSVASKIDEHRNNLGADGNILVRASGTEKLVRVMVEAAEQSEAHAVANDIAKAIQDADKLASRGGAGAC